MTAPDELHIRVAVPQDLPALGHLGADLMRIHHAFDAQRFLSPGEQPEAGYGAFLGAQLSSPEALVLVAERAGAIVGYVYAAIEPESFKELRARAGYIHDILVAGDERGSGAGAQLLEAAVEWVRAQDVPRVLLWTAAPNTKARKLFEAHGFRATMVEMTREL